MNHDMTFTLKYAFMNREEVRPGSIYQGVYQGVGMARHEFNQWLANPISVYLFQGAPIVNLSRRVSLNYEWHLGMAFGWNAYDELNNPENKVIGSKATAYIDVDVYMKWMLSKYLDLNAGISLTHFSNGNTTYPNMGLNTGGIRLGLAYYINRQPLAVPKVEREKLPDRRGLYTDVVLYGAWKQGIAHDGVSSYLLDGKYAVMGFNVNPMYRLNPWLSLGASLDGVYDRSASRENDPWGEDVNHKFSTQAGLGLSARGEFAMPYFSINFGAGTYLLGNRNDFRGVYEVLALKIHVSRRAMLHIATFSSHSLSIASKVLRCSLSISSTAITSPFLITGTTISEREALLQAICPGNFSTSSTTMVSALSQAVPQTPLPRLMRVQASGPWKGPSTRVPSMTL